MPLRCLACGILRASAFILARSCEATREWARSQVSSGHEGKNGLLPHQIALANPKGGDPRPGCSKPDQANPR